MSDMPKSNAQGAMLSLGAFGIFSTHDLVVKLLGSQFSPFQVVFFSVLFAFPVVSIMLLRDRTDGNLIPRYPLWTAARTAAQVTSTVCVFYAFSALPLAQTYAILFAAPLLITVLAIPILGEKVGWQRGAAVLVGLGGVMVVLQPGSTVLGLGHAAAFIGACASALASVIVRKVGSEERNAVLILYPMVANFLLMGAMLPFVYEPMQITHIGGFAIMAILNVSAMLLQIAAYRNAAAGIVAPMQYSQIIWATIFGALIFGESPGTNTYIGAAIVICSGLFIVLRETRKSGSNTPVLLTRARYVQGTLPRYGSFARIMRSGYAPD